jgi:hypothetical protein
LETRRPSTDSEAISVPGKVFLIGEYAVLDGHPAWVATVPPRFRWTGGDASSEMPELHVDSPAARFLSAAGFSSKLIRGRLEDPWEGKGGFGGSTAEFAIAAWLSGVRDPLEARRIYRGLHLGGGSPPSGVDLVAQWAGGVIEWAPESEGGYRDITGAISAIPMLVFGASHLPGRKTRTHAHLRELEPSESRFQALLPAIDLARSGLERSDARTIGTAFNHYADALHELGLEAEEPHADRHAISELPGVLGAKGCGAMQTDALVVVLGPDADAEEIARYAVEDRGLRLVTRVPGCEPGIRVEAALEAVEGEKV